MDDLDRIKLYVDLWKQAVDVQKHFNDIEIRIRSLALTVLTFAVGAAAVAIKDKTAVNIFRLDLHLSAVILFLGALLWLVFYFVDQVWYHRLLGGSVQYATTLEKEIAVLLGRDPAEGLTQQISLNSPYPFKMGLRGHNLLTWRIHSPVKLKIFYWIIAALLIAFGIAAQLAASGTIVTPDPKAPQPAPSISVSSGASSPAPSKTGG
jgi:hypothetical protein